MPSSLRARAAIVAPCLLLAAPAAAQQSDTVNPWKQGGQGDAQQQQPQQPPQPPPPPPPAAPQSGDTVNPWNGQAPPQGAARPGGKARPAPRPPKPAFRPPPPPPRGKRGRVDIPAGVPFASSPTFERLDDGSTRIWVEVSSKVDVAENKAQGRLVYRLRGTIAPPGTSQLPLLTGYFPTPVDRARIVQEGSDCDLIIELRRPSESAQRVIETPRGMVLQVDFPKVAGDPETPVERSRDRRALDTKTIRGGANNDE
jgi:hypothetical protein